MTEGTHAAPKMTEHPHIVAMSARYDRMAESITAQATDALIGLAVAALGASFALAYERTHRLIWVCPLLGAWTIVAEQRDRRRGGDGARVDRHGADVPGTALSTLIAR